MVKLVIVAVAGLLTSASFGEAATWYVDNTIGRDSYDGKSAIVADGHGPFFRIQKAVTVANDGDTVKVAAGVYGDEQDFVPRDATFNAMRVKIAKSIVLEGAGREKTIIKGALDADKGVEKGWCGAKSVGGILLTSAASGAVVKSLTVCTCSQSLRSDNANGNNGIGIGFTGTNTRGLANKPWVVDCVISNVFHCNAPVSNVNLARTLVAYTYGVRHTDAAVNAAIGGAQYANAIHSAFCYLSDVPRGVATDNYQTGSNTPLDVKECGYLVNCVFTHCMNAVTQSGQSSGRYNVDNVLNCAVTEHTVNPALRANTVKDCVLETSSGSLLTVDANVNNLCGQTGFLAAPLFLDFHPVQKTTSIAPEAAAVGHGDSDHLLNFPEEYRWTDYYGKDFSADANGKICAGCSQEPIVPVSAFQAKTVIVDGFPTWCEHRGSALNSWIYLSAADWPRAFELDWDRAAHKKTDVFNYEVPGDGTMVKVPRMDGKAIFVPRRNVRNGTVEAAFPDATYYVSPTGKDTNAGTEAAPVKTIQQAVYKASSTYGRRTLIKVAPGDYAEGGADNNNGKCRVLVGSGLANALIGIRSTDGAETTRIIGAEAPAESRDEYGFGTGATRCVGFFGTCSNSFVQGFTLMNGYCSSKTDGTASAVHTTKGIAAYPFVTVADCIVSNCHGSTSSGILNGVRAVRCRIVDNYNYNYGMVVNSHVVNSLVDGVYDLEPAAGKNNVLMNTPLQGCTILGRDADSMVIPSGHELLFDNIVSDTKKFTSNNDNLYGGMVFASGAGDNNTTKFPENVCRRTVTGDPGFVSKSSRDYRLVVGSPAIGWSVSAQIPGYDVGKLVSDKEYSVSEHNARTRYYDNITYDLDGNRPVMAKGKGVAGCYQRPAAVRVSLSVPADVSVSGLGPDGTLPLGKTAHLSVASSVRKVTTVTVNGQPVDPAGFEIAVPAYDPDTTDWKDFSVSIAVGPSTWYVDAVNGSDEGRDGWTEATAFKTLSRAMRDALDGDTVIALPGTYKDGAVTSPGGTLPTVVAVPSGVKLVSRDGAAATVIEGKVSETFWTDSDAQKARGDGPDNVRCVFLQPRSEIEGFTIRHGGPFKESAMSADKVGGGVYANVTPYEPDLPATPQATVRNCRIELCSGAGYKGVYEHCTIISNINPTATMVLVDVQSLYGCVVALNRGQDAITGVREAVGCTFSDNLFLAGDSIGKCYSDDPIKAPRRFVNCIFHETPGIYAVATNNVKCAWNCIVPRQPYFYSENTKAKDSSYSDPDYRNIVVEKVELDADFRPVNLSGKAVDAVTNEYASYRMACPPTCDVTKDLFGGQRVYNRVQDIGARDADWRGKYAKDIARRNLAVTEASPETAENADGKVEIAKGDVRLVWRNPRTADADQAKMSFEVKGNGTLTLEIDGVTTTYTRTDGVVTVPCELKAKSEKEIVFSYAPAADDTAGAVIGPFECPFGMCLLVK